MQDWFCLTNKQNQTMATFKAVIFTTKNHVKSDGKNFRSDDEPLRSLYPKSGNPVRRPGQKLAPLARQSRRMAGIFCLN